MKLPAQILAVFIAFVLIFSISKATFAQTVPSSTDNNYLSQTTEDNVPKNLHTYTQNIMIEVIYAMSCQLTGIDPSGKNNKCLGSNSKSGKIGFIENNNGIISFANTMISTLFTPPIHSGDYTRYLVGNFGLAKPSFAAATPGIGIGSLSPIANLWVAFRNFAYIVFVIIFLVIGLAIMFRVKIDPRTVMTIQNSIPKIVIGILLVTFSFAIAGFLIDVMYVASYLLIGLVASADPSIAQHSPSFVADIMRATNPIDAVNVATNNNNGFAGLSDIASGAGGAIGGNLGKLFDNVPGRTITGAVVGIFTMMIGGSLGSSIPFVGSLIGGVVAGAIGAFFATDITGAILYALVFLIVAVAIIVSLFRLWFQLIIAYISILIDIIFAPIWIIAGLFPGSKINFSAWIRDLLANLAAFPAALMMFVMARVFLDAFNANDPSNFVPPLTGSPAEPSKLGAVIAMGFILATPNIVKITKGMFKAPNTGFGSIMQGLSSGFGIVQTPFRKISGGLFGKNPYTNQPKTGSVLLGKAFRNATKSDSLSNIAHVATGAGRLKDASGNYVNIAPKKVTLGVNRIRSRFLNGGKTVTNEELNEQYKNQPFQGPVMKIKDTDKYRVTGATKIVPNTFPQSTEGGEKAVRPTPPVTEDAVRPAPPTADEDVTS